MILDEYREEEVPLNLIQIPASFNPGPSILTKEMENIRGTGKYEPLYIKDSGDVIYGHITGLALLNLRYDKINCKIYKSDISNDEMLMIHYACRLKANTSWQEEVKLEKMFHISAQIVYGKAKQKVGNGWSIADSAKALNIAFGKLSEDLSLADAIITDPSLSKFEDKQDAKSFYKMQLALNKANLREPSEFSGKVNFAKLMQPEIFLRTLPEKSIDCIITTRPDFQHVWLKDLFEQCFRLLRDDSYLAMFLNLMEEKIAFKPFLSDIGFETQDHPLIWINESRSQVSKYLWQTGQNYQFILLAAKGKPALVDPRYLTLSTISAKNKKDAIKNLLQIFTNEGDLILDPFAGHLDLASSCNEKNRRWICIEKDRDLFKKGCIQNKLDFYTGERV